MKVTCRKILNLEKTDVFQSRVGIVVPAYNEARHIGAVLDACRKIEPSVVVVVDDGSTDDTMDVLHRIRELFMPSLPLRVLLTGRNLGKQGAVRLGLRELLDWSLDAVALIDGDGQHDPGQLPSLALLLEKFDMVIGARNHDQMPVHRRLSNFMANTAFALITGVDFVDIQSGLRIYSKSLADVLAHRLDEKGSYGIEHESLAVLARHAQEQHIRIDAAAAEINCVYGDAESKMKKRQMLQLAFQTIDQALEFRRASQGTGNENVSSRTVSCACK